MQSRLTRAAVTLGITLVLSVCWGLTGAWLAHEYFPPGPAESEIHFDTTTGKLTWRVEGIRYQIDFAEGVMHGPGESFPLSKLDRYITGRRLEWLMYYCAQSVVWYEQGGKYADELEKEKGTPPKATKTSYDKLAQTYTDPNDPAVKFARSYNEWIQYWNEVASPHVVDVGEVSLWGKTKKNWKRLQGVVDQFYRGV